MSDTQVGSPNVRVDILSEFLMLQGQNKLVLLAYVGGF